MRFFLEGEKLKVTSMPLKLKGIGMVWQFSVSVSKSGRIYISALLGMYQEILVLSIRAENSMHKLSKIGMQLHKYKTDNDDALFIPKTKLHC